MLTQVQLVFSMFSWNHQNLSSNNDSFRNSTYALFQEVISYFIWKDWENDTQQNLVCSFGNFYCSRHFLGALWLNRVLLSSSVWQSTVTFACYILIAITSILLKGWVYCLYSFINYQTNVISLLYIYLSIIFV